MSLTAGTRIGSFEIVEPIGAGGMGEVYRARDSKLGRLVAIKILPETVALDADRLARFDREARVLASLNHRHIAAIYGREQAGATIGLVLELVEGGTLADRLGRPMAVSAARRLALQIVDAMDAAHDRGIVHRDLKPANVGITATGDVKVLDFGLARTVALGHGDDASVIATMSALHTEPGIIMGTAAYMSPEQARGQEVDRRTDVWAFGCILYEMLAGRRAFDGGTTSDIIAAVLNGEPDWSALPANVPRALQQLIRRCLAKEARQRLRDIADARFDLEAGAGESNRSDPPPAGRYRMVIGVVAGLAMAGLFSIWQRPIPPERTTFVIPQPSGVAWSASPTEPFPSVSPNGRRIAYGGTAPDGIRLWVHDIETGLATPIPGIPFSTPVAWAPDSNSFMYCASGKIVRVSLAGSARASFDASECSGRPSWGPNNRVLFQRPGGISQINVAGGAAEQVMLDDPADVRLYPRWLPDGRHLVYLGRHVDSARAGIYLAALDGAPSTRLVPDVSAPVIVEGRDGRVHLLFVRQASLVSQVVNVAERRVEGEARVLATDVPIGMTVRNGAYDAAPTLLVFRGRPVGDTSELVWLDRRGQRQGVIDVRYPLQASISPDESTLAVQRDNVDLNTFEIWQVDVRRGGARPLQAKAPSLANPLWSPDGRELAFLSDESGLWRPTRMRLGGEARSLPHDAGVVAFLNDWSSDGRWIFGMGLGQMLAMDQTGGEALKLGAGAEPALSPDMRWLAYRSSESGAAEVYVRPFPAGGDTIRVSRGNGYKPVWRRDGRELYYRTSAGTVMAVEVKHTANGLDVGEPVPLFTAPFVPGNAGLAMTDYAVTRDGEHFLAVLAKDTTPAPLRVVRNWLQ